MTEPLMTVGEGETFKATIHLCLFGLAMTCCCYNALAYSQRREAHLALNVGVYGALIGYEWWQIRQHVQRVA